MDGLQLFKSLARFYSGNKRSLASAGRHFAAHVRNLPFRGKAQFRKGQAELPMANPLNRGLLDGERLSLLRINPTLERGSERDCGGTTDATAARREVS